MKALLPVLLLLIFSATSSVEAAYYQWVDGEGVLHFTDNRNNIPQKYRKKAKKLKLQEEPAQPKAKAPVTKAAEPPAPAPPAPLPTPGGHPEQWWRDHFGSLRTELKGLQEGLADKQTKLGELRRKRAIFIRIQDREAVNAEQSQLTADESRIAELQQKLEALGVEADKAGVPADWRQ